MYVGTLPPHMGGSAIQGAHVLVGLARRGHRVRAVAQITPAAHQNGDEFARSHPELEVVRMTIPDYHLSMEVRPDDAFRELEGREIERLARPLLAAERPDVIVFGRESFAWHLSRLGDLDGIPRVLFAQGSTRYPPEDATTLVEQFRKMDGVVAAAGHVRERFGGFGVDRVEVVRNAVDLSLFSPSPRDPRLSRELRIEDDDVVVLHASNLKRVKRPLDLVESAAIAVAEEPRLLYLIVGDGPLRQETEEAAAAKGVAHRFRFVEWVDHQLMPAYLSVADIVAMPSETEAQALAYLEAMACARTLLTSDVPGAREVADDGDSAVFFRMGDVHDLAAKTVALARDRELREAIGRRARQRVRRHSPDKVVREYERVLTDVVAGARGRPAP